MRPRLRSLPRPGELSGLTPFVIREFVIRHLKPPSPCGMNPALPCPTKPKSPAAAPSRSFRTRTPAKRRSPKSSCSTAVLSRSRVPSPQRKNQRATTSDWMELETPARHLRQLHRAAVRIPRLRREPARHTGSQGLLRGHLPRAHRRRRRHHGDRRRQRHRGPDPQALRGLPSPRRAHLHLHEQARPRGARAASTLLDELETVLGIPATAINWPLGLGQQFRGVYDRRKKDVHLFERTAHGAYRAPEKVGGLDDDFVAKHRSSPKPSPAGQNGDRQCSTVPATPTIAPSP
jgi:hypothetical protein